MTNEQIDTFLKKNQFETNRVKVSFKTRSPFNGLFIKTADYDELRSKNFWRIVSETNVEKYQRSKDVSLARIFSGVEITKLSAVESR